MSTATPGRRRRSPLTVVGIVLLVAGLGCLGWVGYQFFGTNVVAERSYAKEKEGLRAQWQQSVTPSSTPSGGPSARRTASPKPEPKTEAVIPGEAFALLRIPAFGDGYEVPVLAGTDRDTLARGVGHYESTALPGQLGNFAIAGHRITHGQPFSRLLELNRGDQVVVETRTSVFTYVIDRAPRDLTVQPSASWVLDPVPGQQTGTPSQALLTLTTCQDLFHSPDRSVGFGHLASTRNKG